jgi:hypothetical protein
MMGAARDKSPAINPRRRASDLFPVSSWRADARLIVRREELSENIRGAMDYRLIDAARGSARDKNKKYRRWRGGWIAAARGTAPSINRVFAIPRASSAKLRESPARS